MSSYAHDAEVIVFNYKTRATETATLGGFSIGGATADPMATETVSLREAITSITINKTKGQPQGSFMLTLKPTQEWTKILVPGSWCAIFMSDRPLTDKDISNAGQGEDNGNVVSALKMVGIIMSVRVQKQIDANGAITLTYSIGGYDFGYVFLSSIYINHLFQADVQKGVLKGPLSELDFPQDEEIYGDPAKNVSRVLRAWSILGQGGVIEFSTGDKPPSIRMEIPEAMAKLVGGGKDVLQFVNAVIGIDKRTKKVVSPGDSEGKSSDFEFDLLGEKFFQVWQLITNNTLWGMINQYLNPLLNEAYCDLHVVKSTGGFGGLFDSVSIKPMLVVRQIPFNTPSYEKYWNDMVAKGAVGGKKPTATNYVTLPRTILPPEKVLGYDIGYSDFDRVNFVEVNGFDIDISARTPGAFNNVNKPQFEEGSIRRFGLRPKIFFGADYGAVRGNIDETGYWTPLIMDWWFNGNRYASGTIECIGLTQHIALGENIVLQQEQILGHVEGYTHVFNVDENGNRIFRTNIDFSRGVSSESTSTNYKYVYGDEKFGGTGLIDSASSVSKQKQDASIFEDDVQQRSTYTELKPLQKGSGKGGFGL